MNLILVLIFISYPQKELRELILEVQNKIFVEEFDSAFSLVDKIIEKYPNDPSGYILKSAVLDYYMLDFSVETKREEFFINLNKAEDLAKKYLIKENLKKWGHFFLGLVYSYKAQYFGKKRDFIKAFGFAQNSIKELQKVISMDSTFYDAYMTLGIYYLILSEFSKLFDWLPQVDSKEYEKKGFEFLSKATMGTFVSYPSRNALAYFYAYKKRPNKAIEIASQLLREFPKSRTFRWTLGFAYFNGGYYIEARKVYFETLYLSMPDYEKYPYNLAVIIYYIARTYYGEGDYAKVLHYLNLSKSLLDHKNEWREDLKTNLLKEIKDLEEKSKKYLRKRKN